MSSPSVSQITPRANSSITPSTSTNTALLMNPNRSTNSSANSPTSNTVAINLTKKDSPNSNGTTKITKIITSREWVLPPRPKPGRKPSVDTPATKRKAQNRAAQRAFRERRANRVSELEVQILELEREKSIKEGILTNKIKSLSNENDFLKKSLDELKSTVDALKAQFNNNMQNNNNNNFILSNGKSPSSRSNRSNSSAASPTSITPSNQQRKQSTGSSSASTSAFSNPTGAVSSTSSVNDAELNKAASMMINFKNSSRHGSFSQAPSPLTVVGLNNFNNTSSPGAPRNLSISSYYQQQLSPAALGNNSSSKSQDPATNGNIVPFHKSRQSSQDDDCGVCLKDDCICESVGIKQKKSSIDSFLNFTSFQPVAAVPLKRKRKSSDESLSLEIDFTQQYKKSQTSTSSASSTQTSTLKKMPSLAKLTKSKNNFKQTADNNANTKFNRPSTLMSNERHHYENESLFKSPSVSLDYDASPSASTASHSGHNHGNTERLSSQADSADRISPEDQCGFCSDDSPCVCREIAKQKELTKMKDNVITNQLNQMFDIKEEENYQIKEEETNNGATCTGNPGTCLQCQTDPMSTLFCTTIASKAEEKKLSKLLDLQTQTNENTENNSNNTNEDKSQSKSSISQSLSSASLINPVLPVPRPSLPTYGSQTFGSVSSNIPTPPGNLPMPVPSQINNSSGNESNSSGGVLTPTATGTAVASATTPITTNLSRSNSITSLPSLNNLEINNPGKHFIPCSDAYKTLSRHAHFRNVGFNTIINKLNTNGMYVEVESIVKCLRELDRKFGSN